MLRPLSYYENKLSLLNTHSRISLSIRRDDVLTIENLDTGKTVKFDGEHRFKFNGNTKEYKVRDFESLIRNFVDVDPSDRQWGGRQKAIRIFK